jgi:hypothetical protein
MVPAIAVAAGINSKPDDSPVSMVAAASVAPNPVDISVNDPIAFTSPAV